MNSIAVSATYEFTVDLLNAISLIEETFILAAGVTVHSLRLQELLFLFLLHLSLMLLHQLLLLLLQLLEHDLLLALLVCEPVSCLLLLTLLLDGHLLLLLLIGYASGAADLLSYRVGLLLLLRGINNFYRHFAFI